LWLEKQFLALASSSESVAATAGATSEANDKIEPARNLRDFGEAHGVKNNAMRSQAIRFHCAVLLSEML
jgi:hypothetical protein